MTHNQVMCSDGQETAVIDLLFQYMNFVPSGQVSFPLHSKKTLICVRNYYLGQEKLPNGFADLVNVGTLAQTLGMGPLVQTVAALIIANKDIFSKEAKISGVATGLAKLVKVTQNMALAATALNLFVNNWGSLENHDTFLRHATESDKLHYMSKNTPFDVFVIGRMTPKDLWLAGETHRYGFRETKEFQTLMAKSKKVLHEMKPRIEQMCHSSKICLPLSKNLVFEMVLPDNGRQNFVLFTTDDSTYCLKDQVSFTGGPAKIHVTGFKKLSVDFPFDRSQTHMYVLEGEITALHNPAVDDHPIPHNPCLTPLLHKGGDYKITCGGETTTMNMSLMEILFRGLPDQLVITNIKLWMFTEAITRWAKNPGGTQARVELFVMNNVIRDMKVTQDRIEDMCECVERGTQYSVKGAIMSRIVDFVYRNPNTEISMTYASVAKKVINILPYNEETAYSGLQMFATESTQQLLKVMRLCEIVHIPNDVWQPKWFDQTNGCGPFEVVCYSDGTSVTEVFSSLSIKGMTSHQEGLIRIKLWVDDVTTECIVASMVERLQ
jgi:hypothetical protein